MRSAIDDEKRALRRTWLDARRALLAEPSAAQVPALIRDAFLQAVAPARGAVVSAFWPMPGEMDLRPLLHALHERGCVCALPVVRRPRVPLLFRLWTPDTLLITSSFGIAEPGPDAPAVIPHVAAVPLLAFDDHGYRLGYGGGFYNRTLAALREGPDGASFLAVGVGLSGQRVDRLPHDQFDARLDWIVTESSTTRIAR